MRRRDRKDKGNTTEAGGRGREGKLRSSVRISALFICVMLCGCTRREQLVLETGREVGAAEPVSEGTQENEDSLRPTAAQIFSEPAGSQQNAEQTVGRQVQEVPEAEPLPQEVQTICVHVCGAVKNPDVYELPTGSRVYEAVRQAGGFTEEADESYVNQAQILTDGVKLVIPTKEQIQANVGEKPDERIGVIGAAGTEQDPVGSNAAAGASEGKININTATQEQLCEIPGVGAARAAAIAAYRQEHGGFTKIEDIMNVSGIKEGTYVKIKDSITVN